MKAKTLKEKTKRLKEKGWLDGTESSREIHRLYNLVFERGTSYKKIVKKKSSGLDRTRVREAMANEDFDKIPLDSRAEEEDIWNYD
jgi:hypothetical protein